MNELAFSFEAWSTSVDSLDTLLEQLTPEQWDLPSELPGWSIRDILAHLAHIEAETAGLATPSTADSSGAAVSQSYTETGVEARRGLPVEDVVAEFREATRLRKGQLTPLPTDPDAPADNTPGGMPWDWRTALRNRAFDVWMHEQDIRRVVGIAGGLFHPGGQLSRDLLAGTMPYVLGRKVGAAPGSAVRFLVWGPLPLDLTVRVGDDGKAAVWEAGPDFEGTTLRMGSEVFIQLAGGRAEPGEVEVEITGDHELADAVLAQMALKV